LTETSLCGERLYCMCCIISGFLIPYETKNCLCHLSFKNRRVKILCVGDANMEQCRGTYVRTFTHYSEFGESWPFRVSSYSSPYHPSRTYAY